MQKIISLFQRNYDGDKLVRNEIVSGAEWVLNGEGCATHKYDGTCCLIKDGKFYKRYDAKHGKTPPDNFIPAQEPDPITGHWPGWIEVKDIPNDKWHLEAWNQQLYCDGTYELVGPKINGNRERHKYHMLIPHGLRIYKDFPREYEQIKEELRQMNQEQYCEGIVWHHEDGRMVKIKYTDFFR